MLRSLRDATAIAALARDDAIASVTAYRHLREGIDVDDLTGAGVHVPARRQGGRRGLDPATSGSNACTGTHRAPVERAVAVLEVCWSALHHGTLDPARIGALCSGAGLVRGGAWALARRCREAPGRCSG